MEYHFDDLQAHAWQCAEEKGFHEMLDPIPERYQALVRIALIYAEISEAMQEIKRHGLTNLEKIGEELADIFICIMDFAETIDIEGLDKIIAKKIQSNKGRPKFYGTPWEGLT
jgi:NTP pyrophosphatase (non-canonical NTP hydrolase)